MRPYVNFFDPETLKRDDLTSRERGITELWSECSKEELLASQQKISPYIRAIKGLDTAQRARIKGLDAAIIAVDESRRFFVVLTRWERFRFWLHSWEFGAAPKTGHALVEDALLIVLLTLCAVWFILRRSSHVLLV